jgi:recombination protein RecT
MAEQKAAVTGKPAVSKALTLVDQVNTIEHYLENNKTKLKKALGKWMTMDKMLMLVVNSIRRNPTLAQCSPISIYSCIMQSAQLHLPPDDMRGLAYLVPYWNSKKNVYEAQFMPGYKGLVSLAKDSGEVKNVYSRVVYDKEVFEIEEGLNPLLRHIPLPPAERGNNRGTYTVVEFKDGSKEFTFMWEDDIMKIKNRSKAAGSGPWVSDPDEMRKKTTIRRAMKTRDLSPAMNKAVALDELIDTEVSSREEFEDDDFMTENLAGKPPVAEPQEKKVEPTDAEVVDPAAKKAADDAEFSKTLFGMIQEMQWRPEDEKRKKTNDMIAKGGVSAALDYVMEEYEQWKQEKGKKTAHSDRLI